MIYGILKRNFALILKCIFYYIIIGYFSKFLNFFRINSSWQRKENGKEQIHEHNRTKQNKYVKIFFSKHVNLAQNTT